MKDPKVKANFDKARNRNAAKKQEPSTTTEFTIEADDAKTLPIRRHHNDPSVADLASSSSVLKISDYIIMNCWILDSGSNIHICNNSSRFTVTHISTPNDYLVSGSRTRKGYPATTYPTTSQMARLSSFRDPDIETPRLECV